MKTISLKLSDALDARLVAVARRRGRTKSAFIREIIEDRLGHPQEGMPGSLRELAGKLIGCVEGAGDLSCNRERMREYGR